MRKHLLALSCIFGLAGASTLAWAQAPKGSQTADTKSASTTKASKAAQESAAGQGGATNITVRKAGGEQDAAKQDSSKKVLIGLSQPAKDDTGKKMRKAGGEQQAAASAQGKKDAKTNAGFADGSVRTSHTGGGGGAGKVAHQEIVKTNTGGGASKVAHQEIVKTSTGGGAGKVAHQEIVKTKKSDSEIKAAQQDATMKQKKEVNQASPK